GFWFFITQFLQSVLGYSGFQAGLAFLPMTVVNFAVAVGVPRLTQRLGNGRLLACGLTVTLIGMAWLSRLSADTSYLMGIALPMVLIGVGQGAALSPLTASGIIRVAPEDAGAASGLVNVAHQLGGSLGLGILVTIFASVTPAPSAPRPCWRIASPSRSPPGPPCWPWRSSWSSPSSSGRSRQLTSPMPTLPGPRPRRMRSRLRPRWL